jgi:hypothetical protein
MYSYSSSNPCLCGTPTTPSTPQCPDDCNCLKVCSISINQNDSRAVGPCAKTGTLNVMGSGFGHDFCACGSNTPRWTVEDFDSTIFTTALITKAGVLTWISRGTDSVGKYGIITLKVCCGALSFYTEVIIGIKDLCDCPECNDCETCDPCTGECNDAEVNLFFKPLPVSGNTELN